MPDDLALAEAPPAADPAKDVALTCDELIAMVEAGVFAERGDDLVRRLELEDGRIVAMPPEGMPHEHAVSRAIMAFAKHFPIAALEARGLALTSGGFLRLGAHTGRSSDVMIRSATDGETPLSGDMVKLICEASQSSLSIDLGRKKRDYATAGVMEYWVIDIAGRRLRVFRDPIDAEYATAFVRSPGEAIAALFWPEIEIPVAELF